MRSRAYRLIVSVMILALSVIFAGGTTAAASLETQDESIIALIELLKEKGVVSEEEAQLFVERLKKPDDQPDADEERVITIIPVEKEDEYIDRISKKVARNIETNVKDDVKDEIRFEMVREDREMGRDRSVPDWVRRIKWGGDIRLRYQGDYYGEDNAAFVEADDWGSLANTTEDRHRFRYRVRVGMKAEVNEITEVGIRLATGNEDDPVSTNDTLGDMFNKDTVTFDQAYIKVVPIQEIELWGGRIPNPFFYTDLVWDSDLSFEGFATRLNVPFNKKFSTFFNAGVFPLEEFESTGKDKWLYAGQVGFELKPQSDVAWKLGTAYYHYDNVTGIANDPLTNGRTNWSAPEYQQKGNTLFNINPLATSESEKIPALASEFKELNITTELDFGFWYPVHVILTADYVKNLGFDIDDVRERAGDETPEDLDEGYQVGITVGHKKVTDLGQWKASLFYKYLEGDAVLDAFTDSDFHGGGSNAEGWILRGEIGVWKNLWLTTKWISADEIDGPPLAIDTFQVDMNAKF